MLSDEPARELLAARLISLFMDGPLLMLAAAAATVATSDAATAANSDPAQNSQHHMQMRT
jgi:hypothetical protein